MEWQIVVFNWTGFITLMLILLSIIAGIVYWIFNEWLKTMNWMWHVAIIAWSKSRGSIDHLKTFTEKDGKKYKIVEVK